MKSGVAKVYKRNLYPGYVFVEMACEEDGAVPENIWFMIKETTGVGDFIGSDGIFSDLFGGELFEGDRYQGRPFEGGGRGRGWLETDQPFEAIF